MTNEYIINGFDSATSKALYMRRQENVKRYTTTLATNWPLWCAVLDSLPEVQRKALRDDIRTMLGIDDVGISGIDWPRYVREVIALFVS